MDTSKRSLLVSLASLGTIGILASDGNAQGKAGAKPLTADSTVTALLRLSERVVEAGFPGSEATAKELRRLAAKLRNSNS